MTLHLLTPLSSLYMRQPSDERTEGQAMSLDLFSRKLVLLVEDEPLIALNVEHHLRKAGRGSLRQGISMPRCLWLDIPIYRERSSIFVSALRAPLPSFSASQTGTYPSSSIPAMPPAPSRGSGPRSQSFRNPHHRTRSPTPSRSLFRPPIRLRAAAAQTPTNPNPPSTPPPPSSPAQQIVA